jgi:hypothetical protein
MGGIILVNDRMQSGYCYCRTERMGANFHPESEPELPPKEMLQLEVFCGKYMTDTRSEFPEDWAGEDRRQIKRWKAIRRPLRQIQVHCEPGDLPCRRRQRQTLLHWAYDRRQI